MVDVAGAMDVVYTIVIAGIEPSYEMTGCKLDVGNTEPDGTNAGVGVRVGGIDIGMP
ncbi:hypothetical protein KI387_030111, partial [Taxus chinensis]